MLGCLCHSTIGEQEVFGSGNDESLLFQPDQDVIERILMEAQVCGEVRHGLFLNGQLLNSKQGFNRQNVFDRSLRSGLCGIEYAELMEDCR